MGKADAAVELRVAGELTLEPRHTDQDQPDVVTVEEVAELLEGVRFEPVRLMDDHQLRQVRDVDVLIDVGGGSSGPGRG